ncbi:hypothetical protein DFJ77DRAFT_509057 [Powellomyces hirtus]|nr:hypothetical protein DFJ77DRAFT_509057 [Powellomyces hirtus]
MSGIPPSAKEILEGAGQTSIATFLSALAFNSAVAAGFFTAFWVLRTRFPLVYMPRTIVLPENIRTKPLTGRALLRSCIWPDSDEVIRRSGQDAYAILFYTRQMFIFFGSLVGLAVITLFPLHATGGQKLYGLDTLTLANIAPASSLIALAADLILMVHSHVYALMAMCTISRLEGNRRSLDGYTLLIRDIPRHLREANKLRVLFDRVQPGCVHAVVVGKRSRKLDTYAARRISARDSIEEEITRYLTAVVHRRAGRKRRSSVAPGRYTPETPAMATRELDEEAPETKEMQMMQASDEAREGCKELANPKSESGQPMKSETEGFPAVAPFTTLRSKYETKSVTIDIDSDPSVERRHHFAQSVNNGGAIGSSQFDENSGLEGTASAPRESEISVKRPIHRSMYLIGHESDSISMHLTTLRKTAARAASKRRRVQSTPTQQHGAAFVVFKDVFSPHVAALANIDPRPGIMDDRHPSVNPTDVIWQNLDLSFRVRKVRTMLATAFTAALTLAWASMMTVINTVATLDRAIQYMPWLAFFDDFSTPVRGVIQGVVPIVVVTLLFMLVPIIMRHLSHFAGQATYSGIERSLLRFYYIFLVFNVLLVITVSGSVITALQTILDNPQRILSILATSIPMVSNFFVNYVMLLALGGPSGELLQLGTLIVKPLAIRYLGTTPRKIREWCKPNFFYPGTALAQHSFVATVGLTYCTIAPLVLVFVVIYFGLYHVAYGYQMQYVYQHMAQTGGLYLNVTARQLFVGIYLHQLVLIGLFLLKKAYMQAIIMGVAFAITAVYHHHTSLYKPIMAAVPAKAVVQMEAKLARKGQIDEDLDAMWDQDGSATLLHRLKEARSTMLGEWLPAWKKAALTAGSAIRSSLKLNGSADTVHTDVDIVDRCFAESPPPTSEPVQDEETPSSISRSALDVRHKNDEEQSFHGIASVPGHRSTDSVASDSDSEIESVRRSRDDLDSNAIPSKNVVRRYLGPPDFQEMLSPPSCRSSPCTIWIPKDMCGYAETALAREIEEAVGDAAIFTSDWAKVESNGRIKIDLFNAVPCTKFDT